MTQRSRATLEILGGVVLPLVCFIFDPVVFRQESGRPWLGPLLPFAYTAAATAMLMFSYSLLVERPSNFRAGVLLAAAIVSAVIGLLIFPVALVGIFAGGIGLLGFVPFLTAFVYWRVARRTAIRFRSRHALAGALLFLFIPFAIQLVADNATTMAIRALPHPAAMRVLAAARPFLGLDDLVWSYSSEPDAARKQILATAYRQLTGEDIEARLNELND